MAIAQAALVASQSVVKYAPKVYDKGMQLVSKATSGRIQKPSDIVDFVKGDPRKLSVVAGALAAGGVSVDDLVPKDLAAINPQLAQIRASVETVAMNMRGQFDRGSDSTVAASDLDTARDILRKQRVRAVLDVYGSAEKYFLCHPNGGIPRGDFAWFSSMGFR